MPRRSRFEQAFEKLFNEHRARKKSSFLDDIRGQLDEDEAVSNILRKSRVEPRFVAVSFDRMKNDKTFLYGSFDLMLVALDAVAGGVGIRKPINQFRVLRWNGTRSDLSYVIRYLMNLNPQIRVFRFLVLPYPEPIIGKRISKSVYRK